MTERHRRATGRNLPEPRGVVAADPGRGGGSATPSFDVPDGSGEGLPGAPAPLTIGPRTFEWGVRTFVMGIVNVTPDSFSGDGLLGPGGAAGDGVAAGDGGAAPPIAEPAGGARGDRDPVALAVALAHRMAGEGADLLDIGGESSRPGHAEVDEDEEIRRVVPVIHALRVTLPAMPISVDTVKPAVAEAALAAGAHLLNDVWGVSEDDALARVAADFGVPLIVMHNRAEARYRNLVSEVLADLERAVERTVAAGVAWEKLIVDPGFGFGKAPDHNIVLLRALPELRLLGRPVLLGASRKSTLGKLLDLPAAERLEASLATTVLGIDAGVDMVRVHDVRPHVRAARIADAVRRGWRPAGWSTG